MQTEQEIPTTKQKLLQMGKDEFYRDGYLQASLRRICAACGVTTGAFYFFFPNKDALFCSIVDPVIEQWLKLAENLAEKELEDLSSGRENDRIFMEFEYRHKKEILILVEKSAGSSRENFKDVILETMTRYFTRFFFHAIGHEPDPEIIKLLVSIRFQSNLSVLKGAEDMKQALFLNDVLACYADGGFQSLIRNLNDVL
ncbi:TetR/AcrR family transcriptional regulator [Lachnospiraceae bacterium 54-53]